VAKLVQAITMALKSIFAPWKITESISLGLLRSIVVKPSPESLTSLPTRVAKSPMNTNRMVPNRSRIDQISA